MRSGVLTFLLLEHLLAPIEFGISLSSYFRIDDFLPFALITSPSSSSSSLAYSFFRVYTHESKRSIF